MLNYAEVKALAVGNPLMKKKVEITNEIDRLRILQNEYIATRQKMERELSALPEQIAAQKKRIADTEDDIAYYASNKVPYKTLDEEQKTEMREKIYAAVKTHINKPFETKILTYQGFDVVVPARMRPQPKTVKSTDESGTESKLSEPIPYVYVKRKGVYYMEIESLLGTNKRLNNLLEGLGKVKERREGKLEALINKQATLEAELAKNGDSHSAEIEKLAAELMKIDEKLGVA